MIWETKGEAERPGAWPGRSGAPLGVGPAAGGERVGLVKGAVDPLERSEPMKVGRRLENGLGGSTPPA